MYTLRRTLFSAIQRPVSRQIASIAARRISTSRPRNNQNPSQAKVVQSTSSENQDGKAKATEAKAFSTAEKEDKNDGLPLLSRPLGVKELPSTETSTWTQNMLNPDVRMEQRDKLVRAVGKGYFAELNATRRNGGKSWIAPRVLIREDKARYFPDIAGTPLNSSEKLHTTSLCLGKVSIISMLSSKMSEIQTSMLVKSTHEAFSSNPSYQHIQINLQENLLKSFLVSLFASSIRKSIPEAQWGKYLISSQSMDYIRDDIGMTNKHLGYVYLVDQACRVRWAACADPKLEEIEALKACTSVLLKRYQS